LGCVRIIYASPDEVDRRKGRDNNHDIHNDSSVFLYFSTYEESPKKKYLTDIFSRDRLALR